MARITLAEARPQLCRAVDNGVPINDPRVPERINQATERLMAGGIFVGMVQEYVVCTQAKCFTLPREIESVMEVFILDQSLDVTSGWYSIENPSTYVDPEFLNDIVLVDRGEYPTLFDICTPGQLIVFSQYTENTGSEIRIFGLDPSGNEIYTIQPGGGYAPGEMVPLSISGTTTVNTFSKITNIEKPQTQGPVRVYEVDPANAGNHIMLAILDPTERVPSYRRYYCDDIPVITLTEPPVRIRITGIRRFLPIQNDTDFMILSNLGALRLEMMALDREDGNDFQSSAEFHKRALDLLQAEAKQYQQDPTRVSYRKAQCLNDEQSYDKNQLGHVRARLALENPQFLRVGLRNITRGINTAQERLVSQGYWKNTVVYLWLKILGDGYIIPPPNVESIVTLSIKGRPMIMRNRWFESHEDSVGEKTALDFPVISAIDRGTGPTFFPLKDPTNITVGSTSALDVGQWALIQGYDQNGNEVDNQIVINGITWAGEQVFVNTSSNTLFSNVTAILKPLTQGSLQLWAYGLTLASMPPWMRVAEFRRWFIAGLGDNPLPFDSAAYCQCKLKARNVWDPQDFLTVTNYPALKEMLFAIANEEAQKLDIAQVHEQRAYKILNDELRAHRGSATATLNIQMHGWMTGAMRKQPI
jgi:hypothetical protein